MGGNYSKNYCVSLGTSEQGDNRSQSRLVGREYLLFCLWFMCSKQKKTGCLCRVEFNLVGMGGGGGAGSI